MYEFNSVELTYICKQCQGSGKVWPPYKQEDCSNCQGVGELPTEAGTALLRFLRAFANFDLTYF